MTFLSASDMAGLRNLATSAMTSTCQIKRVTRTQGQVVPDDTASWPTVATVPCFVSEATRRPAQEQTIGGVVTPVQPWYVDMPLGTDVRVTDRLLIADANSSAVTEFEVNDTDVGRSLLPMLRVSARTVH